MFIFGAQEKTRTSTPVKIPAPEAGASTNSATWAKSVNFIYRPKHRQADLLLLILIDCI